MKKFLYSFTVVLFLLNATIGAKAQTTLAVGDLSIIGFNSGAPDNFVFVCWVDLQPNTVIKFMDNGFNTLNASASAAGNVRTTENFVVWNSGSNVIKAGTVIRIQNESGTPEFGSTTFGSIVAGTLNAIAASGDQIFAYQGAGNTSNITGSTTTSAFAGTILFGLNFQGSGSNGSGTWLTSGAASSNKSYLPSELNVANANITFGTNTLNGFFNGSRSNQVILSDYKSIISNIANWTVATTGIVSLDLTPFNDAPVVWTGSKWSNITGSTSSLNASIEGAFSTTATNQFTAKNLTINAGGSLTINAGHNIEVTGSINNTLTADKFVIESNANLVQVNVATNTGNITVKRNTNIKRLDYTYWSSPVAQQTLADLSPATLPNRFYGLNNTNAFVAVASTTAMVEATGYSVRAPNNFTTTPAPFTANFIGKPTNGTQTITFPVADGSTYKLLGNPYPCTVDAVQFLDDNPGSLHFWTHSVYQTGAANYATYSKAGTTITFASATTTPALGGSPNGIIQVGQGFMYLPASGDTEATFINEMKMADNDDQFFRTAQLNNNKLWLNLTQDNNFSQILVAYMPNATTGFDVSMDAKQINSTGNVLYSIIENNELAIQGRPTFDANDVVNLGFKSLQAGNQTIAIDHTEGVFSNGQNIFLKDNMTNTIHNLSNGGYTFATEIGTFNNRFAVVYASALSNQSNVFDADSVVVFNNNSTLTVNSGNVQMKSVKVFDLQGRTIFERNNIDANTVSIANDSLRNQVGIVQITSNENIVISKKVVF